MRTFFGKNIKMMLIAVLKIRLPDMILTSLQHSSLSFSSSQFYSKHYIIRIYNRTSFVKKILYFFGYFLPFLIILPLNRDFRSFGWFAFAYHLYTQDRFRGNDKTLAAICLRPLGTTARQAATAKRNPQAGLRAKQKNVVVRLR